MQQAVSENLKHFEEELVNKMLEEVGPERRVRGLTPEELADALSEEQAARLLEALKRKQSR